MTIDQTFTALADPTRVQIVQRLSRGSASVSELAEPHAMTLRAILKHVRVLEEAGLVRTAKEGRVRRCELQRRQIQHTTRWLENLQRRWDRRLDRLEAYTAQEGTS